jgi:drug/metabolite transporter (DMT)-like permease
VTYRHAVRVVLALAGIFLLIGPGGDVNLIGIAWLAVSIVAFAFQLVILQWYLLAYDARTVTLYVLLAMTLGVLIWWWIQGMPVQTIDTRGWFVIIWLAVISTYISRLLLFGAVTRIGGAQMALLSPLETLLAVIWSILFLGEHLTPLQWVGGFLVMFSAALAVQRLGRARLRPRWRLWAKS